MNEKLRAFFEKNDYLRNSVAEQMGISRIILSNLVARGELERVAQGLYALPDNVTDELVVISCRSPSIVFSHETALVLHGLHNRIPENQSVTIPQGCSAPHSIAASVKVYRVKPEWHNLGKAEATTIMGHNVPCYDPERTICDVIRSYSRMDVETYANALRNYAKSHYDLPKLMSYANILGIGEKVRKTLEVLI